MASSIFWWVVLFLGKRQSKHPSLYLSILVLGSPGDSHKCLAQYTLRSCCTEAHTPLKGQRI